MIQLFLIFQVIISGLLILFILFQKTKGSAVGASFGASSSQTFFGSNSPFAFLSKIIAILAGGLFVFSILSNIILDRFHQQNSFFDRIEQSQQLDQTDQTLNEQSSIEKSDEMSKTDLSDIPS